MGIKFSVFLVDCNVVSIVIYMCTKKLVDVPSNMQLNLLPSEGTQWDKLSYDQSFGYGSHLQNKNGSEIAALI